MDDATKFMRIFGDHETRPVSADRLVIRDSGYIADLKERVLSHAGRDSLARGIGWSVSFSPTQTDDLTERSMFHATLKSATEGERRLSFVVARDWVEFGDGAIDSSVRSSMINLEMALENVFRRVVSRSRDNMTNPAAPERL